MANEITLTLTFPPSANRYWRRGRNGVIYTSKEALKYKEGVAKQCAFQGIKPLQGNIKITVHCYMPQTNRDLGNTAKCLEDSLQGFLYQNDLQIVEQHYYRHEAVSPKKTNAKVVITVMELE